MSRRRGATAGRLLVAVAVAALVGGCTGGEGAVDVNNGGQFRFVQGTPGGDVIAAADRISAPQLSGTLLDGAAFDPASLDGSVTVVNFWGSWCAPCRVETPYFQDVYADVRDEGVAFLGVNVKEDVQLAEAFVAEAGVEFPSLYDPRGEVALAFREIPPQAIPSTILFDRDGRIAAVYIGTVSEDDLRAVIDQLLAET